MRISVALATFNGERFLEEQLDSLARQSELPAELVVCDDGSTDATVDIVGSFARASAFPVHVHVNEKRLGVGDNFLSAAARCTGDAIAFCDQDDVWESNKLSRCADALGDRGVVLVVHKCRVVDESLHPTGALFPRFTRTRRSPPLDSDKWLAVPGNAMVFRSELVSDVDWRKRPRSHFLPDGILYHDEWIYGLGRVLGTIVFLAEPLSSYRQHPENVTGAPLVQARALGHSLRGAPGYYAQRLRQAEDWVGVLEDLAATAKPDRRDRLKRAADSYARLAEALALRVGLYEPRTTIRDRITIVAGMVGHGAYGSRTKGAFGVRGLVRDLLVAAIPGRAER